MSIQSQFDLAVEVNTRPTCFRAITTQKEKDDVTKLLDTFNRFYESIVDIHSGIYRMIFLTLEAYFKHGVIKTYPNYEKYIELIVKAVGKMIRCEDEVFNLYALRFIFILYEDYYDLIKVHIYILFKCLFFALNKDFHKVENYNASIGTCYQFLIYFMELEFMNNKELIFRYVESGFSIKCPNLRLRYVFLLEYIIKLADDDFIEMNHMKIDQMIIKSFDDKALLIRQAGSIVYHSYCRKNVNRAYELYQTFNTNQKRNTRCKTNRALHQHVIRRPKIYSAYLKDAEIPNILGIVKKHILPYKRELEHKKRISQYEEESISTAKKAKLEMHKREDSDTKAASDAIQSLSSSKPMFKQINIQIKGIFEKFVADNISFKDRSISSTHFTSVNQNGYSYKNTQRMSSDGPNPNERKIDQGSINGEKKGHGFDGKIKITVKKEIKLKSCLVKEKRYNICKKRVTFHESVDREEEYEEREARKEEKRNQVELNLIGRPILDVTYIKNRINGLIDLGTLRLEYEDPAIKLMTPRPQKFSHDYVAPNDDCPLCIKYIHGSDVQETAGFYPGKRQKICWDHLAMISRDPGHWIQYENEWVPFLQKTNIV